MIFSKVSSESLAGKTVVVTGHRPDRLGGYHLPTFHASIKDLVYRTFASNPPQRIISGMALGFDQWCAEAARRLNIPFEAYVPEGTQDSRWPKESQKIYRELLAASSLATTVYGDTYAAACFKRNEAMVNLAFMSNGAALTLWDPHSSSGTTHCVNYALSLGVPVYGFELKHGTKGEIIIDDRLRRVSPDGVFED